MDIHFASGKFPRKDQEPRNADSDCARMEKPIFPPAFFPSPRRSQRDRRLSREQKRPRGIPKKKKKKKGKSENSWNERALQSWMLSLHNWSIRFWLHRFLLSAGETLLNFARKSYEGIFLIFIRIQDFLMLVQISQIVLAKYDFPF